MLPCMLKAQLVLNAQLPSAGFVQKDQLWNLVIVNNKDEMLNVTLQMNLQDAASGQVVLSAISGNVILAKGVKIITAKDIQPLSYNYNVPDMSRDYLSMGAYIACYQVLSNNGTEVQQVLAQECIRFNIDPLSPPLLNTPNDKARLQSPYPEFTWMPPTPYEMFTNLNYELLVTEVLPGQSATEAIQYNSPVYSRTNISQPYEMYPSTFIKLDTGKVYAWQVVASNGLNYAGKTEVWTFKIAPVVPVIDIVEQTPFIKMKRDNPEKGVAPNGILKLSYVNETTDTMVRVQLVDRSDKGNLPHSFDALVGRGENLLQKNIQKVLNTSEGKLYEAYIINSRNEKWRIFFEVRKYKEKKAENK